MPSHSEWRVRFAYCPKTIWINSGNSIASHRVVRVIKGGSAPRERNSNMKSGNPFLWVAVLNQAPDLIEFPVLIITAELYWHRHKKRDQLPYKTFVLRVKSNA